MSLNMLFLKSATFEMGGNPCAWGGSYGPPYPLQGMSPLPIRPNRARMSFSRACSSVRQTSHGYSGLGGGGQFELKLAVVLLGPTIL